MKFLPTVPGVKDYESVMIFSGNDDDKALADDNQSSISDICSSAEIFSCLGGQNIYNYVIAFS
jgi:hypothetical protein